MIDKKLIASQCMIRGEKEKSMVCLDHKTNWLCIFRTKSSYHSAVS